MHFHAGTRAPIFERASPVIRSVTARGLTENSQLYRARLFYHLATWIRVVLRRRRNDPPISQTAALFPLPLSITLNVPVQNAAATLDFPPKSRLGARLIDAPIYGIPMIHNSRFEPVSTNAMAGQRGGGGGTAAGLGHPPNARLVLFTSLSERFEFLLSRARRAERGFYYRCDARARARPVRCSSSNSSG